MKSIVDIMAVFLAAATLPCSSVFAAAEQGAAVVPSADTRQGSLVVVLSSYSIPTESVADALALLGLPDPCPEAQPGEFVRWGRSSLNDDWLVLGSKPSNLPRIGAPRSCPEAGRFLYMSGPSGLVSLPADASDADVSDNGVVALSYANNEVVLYDSRGIETGRFEESWGSYRCGPGVQGGFIPGSDLLVRFGLEPHGETLRGVVRCTNPEGKVVWQYEASGEIFRIRQTEDGFLSVCLRTSLVLLAPNGFPTDTLMVDCR